jgi:hypothetical protein
MGDARTAAQRDQVGAERYQRRQREIRSGRARATDGVRLREFDKNGFPVPQASPGFFPPEEALRGGRLLVALRTGQA